MDARQHRFDAGLRLGRRLHRFLIFAAAGALAIAAAPGSASAQVPPLPPHEFIGTASLDGEAAPIGAIVSAWNESDEQVASTAVALALVPEDFTIDTGDVLYIVTTGPVTATVGSGEVLFADRAIAKFIAWDHPATTASAAFGDSVNLTALWWWDGTGWRSFNLLLVGNGNTWSLQVQPEDSASVVFMLDGTPCTAGPIVVIVGAVSRLALDCGTRPPPHQFFGSVSTASAAVLNGAPAPDGATVTAWNRDGEQVTSTVLRGGGWLIAVNPDDAEFVSFVIDGAECDPRSLPVVAGSVERIALTCGVEVPTSASLSPSGAYVAYAGPTVSVQEALNDAADAVTSIWFFDRSARQWVGWNRALPEDLRAFNVLQNGLPYFVFVDQPTTWTFPEPVALDPPVAIDLQPGGNPVAYAWSTLPIEEAFADLLPSVDAVWRYWSGAWEIWNPLVPSSLRTFSQLEHGSVYWIVASRASTWSAPTTTPTALVSGERQPVE